LTYTDTAPEYGAAWGEDYVIGDANYVLTTICAATATIYYRVIAPFTSADATKWIDLETYCEPISAAEFAAQQLAVVRYEEDAEWVAGDLIVNEDQFYVATTASTGGVATWTFAEDLETFGFVKTFANPPVTGSVAAYTEEIPEYIEFDGYREIVAVGIRGSDGEWSEEYECRIDQSTDQSVPVKVYTEDLPDGTELEVLGYRWPTKLSSVAVPMEVPAIHQEGVLRALVMQSVEEENYGASVYWVQRTEKLLEDWYNYINRSKTKAPQRKRTITYNRLAG
jgi:hypothetical protein